MTDPEPGAIVHAEITSTDLAATRTFYEGVFGWKFKKESMAEGEYWTFTAANGPGGGLTSPMEGSAPATLNYLLVASVETAVKKIVAHGGKILIPRTEIPHVGYFATYEAPGGLVGAIYEPKR
jgi:predicted enzyme related to lactoylglutathione lyase